MIGLYHVITHYNTIIRYYFPYYFSYYDTLDYPIIFPITSITDYFSLSFLLFSIMTGCRHPENGNVQPAILASDPFTEEWPISVDEQCPLNCIDWKARIEKGKQPDSDAVFHDYYTHYFYYYAHYFSWLSWIAVAVSTSYALQIYILLNWFCVLQQT